MQEMTLAVNAATTPIIQFWMNWIMLAFLFSLLFVWRHPPARIVLAAFVLSAIAGWAIFQITKNVWLLGLSHLLFWGPLAHYLWFKVVKQPSFKKRSPYGIWVIILLITIVISLLFDIRDITLTLFGLK